MPCPNPEKSLLSIWRPVSFLSPFISLQLPYFLEFWPLLTQTSLVIVTKLGDTWHSLQICYRFSSTWDVYFIVGSWINVLLPGPWDKMNGELSTREASVSHHTFSYCLSYSSLPACPYFFLSTCLLFSNTYKPFKCRKKLYCGGDRLSATEVIINKNLSFLVQHIFNASNHCFLCFCLSFYISSLELFEHLIGQLRLVWASF